MNSDNHSSSNNSASYNHIGWLFFLSSTFLSMALVFYFIVLDSPVDLGEGEDLAVVQSLFEENVDISQVQDFWVSSELMIKKGRSLYTNYCATCHGPQGRGDGVAGRGLRPPPRDFTKGQWKFGGTRVDLFKVITQGSEGTSMASFSHIPKLERWAIVHFVRSISGNLIQDDLQKTKEFAQGAQ